jgi:hypothetical protein
MKKINLNKIGDITIRVYLGVLSVWLVGALSIQIFFLYLTLTGQRERTKNIINEIEWMIDGTFKNDPNNVRYEGLSVK